MASFKEAFHAYKNGRKIKLPNFNYVFKLEGIRTDGNLHKVCFCLYKGRNDWIILDDN